MNNTNEAILELINENKSLDEIANILNYSNKQIFRKIRQLQHQGYSIKPEYFNDGNIIYKLSREIITSSNELTLNLTDSSNFKAVVISDLHFGSIDETLPALYLIYDYCAKEGINIILNTGDIVDGSFGKRAKKIDSLEEQLQYLIKKYPYDKNILNFLLLGNHDFSLLKQKGINIETALKNARYDIIPLGYSVGIIRIKNDSITLIHPIKRKDKNCSYINESSITLAGHKHEMKTRCMPNKIIIDVPTLSGLFPAEDHLMPEALEINATLRKGVFDYVSIKQLMVGSKIYVTNHTTHQLRSNEDFPKILQKTP